VADAKKVIRPIVLVLCVGVTTLGLINVYGDNTEVKSLAEHTACGKRSCTAKMTYLSRTPIGQTWEFQIDHATVPAKVECQKKFFLVGDWSCERVGAPSEPPVYPSASATPKR
jgi:hypothetical protein